jgi:pSer/pThr/pTyr-binding forkhead associated (FHA) protein
MKRIKFLYKNGKLSKESNDLIFFIIRSYLIGRNPEKTNITISEGTISRIHAELTYSSEGKLLIKDLGSGTTRNYNIS